jgi:ERI1 exoribonuclease 2
MLEFECRFKDIAKPTYFDRWVRTRAAQSSGAGLQWVGRLHCGLDDARNTAYLLVEMMRRGVTISITGSLTPDLAPKEEDKTPPPQLLQPQHQHVAWGLCRRCCAMLRLLWRGE